MKHIHRLILNAAVKNQVGYAARTFFQAQRNLSKGTRSVPYMTGLALGLTLSTAYATPAPSELPSGGQVTSGSASIAVNSAQMDVNQASQNASLNWQTFNIGQNAQVDFHQPNASAIAVNRIADTNGSQIMGRLSANGQVYLINPNGILFGQGSQVNVGGLVASTLDMNDADLNGNTRTFSGTGTGSVINKGTLHAANGGSVALIGNTVSNQGTITAQLGTVALGAGNAVTLTFSGNSLVKMQVDQSVLNSLAENGGLIQADGGQVIMTAGAKNALLASVVNNTGVIEARTVEQHEGVITLLGGMAAGTVNVGGTLDASVLPSSGAGGEGANGGTSTGSVQANGGFIETSAHNVLLNNPTVTASAPYGKGGTWFIDPTDITIDAAAAATYSTTLSGGTNVTVATVAAGADLGNITVSSSIAKTAGGAATLTLQAHNNIIVSSGVTISSTFGALNVVFNSDADASGAGNIQMNSGSSITTNGGNITLGGGADPATTAAVGTGTVNNLYGVYLNNAALNAGAGNISIRGTGVAGTTSAYGIYALGGTTLTTTSGNITLNGAGGAGSNFNYGVYLVNAGTNITSTTGAISITGTGGAGTDSWNYGIYMDNGAAVTSTGAATVTLNGTGGAGANDNYGVYLVSAGTNVTSATGAISITGQGAGSGADNYGIVMFSGAAVTSTGSANITLDGRGAGTALGIGTGTGSNTIGGASDTGNITLIADSASGADSISLSNLTIRSTGNLLLEPLNAATTIGLAGGAGAFNLSAIELGYIQNSFANLTIGRANGTGAITTGAWTPPASANLTLQNPGAGSGGIAINGTLTWEGWFKNLTLNTSGAVTQTAAISAHASGLELLGAGATYTLTHANNLIARLAGNTGTVSLVENSGFAIGTVNTVGLTTSGNTTLNNTGAVTQTAAITASGLELLGAGGAYTLTNTGNAITTLAGDTGTVSLVENSGFAIGTVNTVGLTTSGNTTLSSTGAVTQTAAITVAGLELLGAGGSYTLTNAGNLITTLAANTGSINVTNNKTLTVGTVNTAGITTTGDLTLTATGAGAGVNAYGLYLNATTLNAGAGNISIKGTGVSSTADAYGIYALGGTVLQTTSGNITLNGTGGAGTNNNIGVYLSGAGTNITSATGAISITGQGAGSGHSNYGIYMDIGAAVTSTGAATITLNGTGGAGADSNYGVYLYDAGTNISSATGAISITGTGGAGTSGWNHGIVMDTGAAVTSTGSATITLNGTGGAGTSVNYGVSLVSAGTNITSATGAISITGQGAGSGAGNYGILMESDAAVTSTGSANITLDGSGAGTAQGILTVNGGNTIGGASDTGNITLIANTATGADSISLANLVIQSTGNLLLQPLNAATSIGLAGGAGAFNLSATELGYIQNGFANITIGKANGTGAITTGAWTVPASANLTLQNPGTGSGGIAINGALTVGAGKNLTLNSTGAVTQTAAITAAGLELLGAGGAYTLTHAGNAITTLAGNTGTVSYAQADPLIIGTVNTAGLTASNTVLVQTTGATSDITLNNAVTANGAGDALILAAGQNFINNAGATPLSASNGRYLVYSTDPAANTFGGFTSPGNYFNCVYGGCTPASGLGSRMVYSITPALTITANAAGKTYNGFAAGDPTALTLNPGTPPQLVSDVVAQLVSTMLSSPVNSQAGAPGLSPTITVAQSFSSDTANDGDTSLPESGDDVALNTKLSSTMKIGDSGPTLTIEPPGVKLPDNVNE